MFKPMRALLLVAGAMTAFAVSPALATPTNITSGGFVALATGASFIVGDLTFTITSCGSAKNPGICTGNGTTTGAEFIANGTTGFTLAGPSGGTLETTASSGYANGYDTTINFTVATNDSNFLGGVNLGLTGSGQYVHASETLQTPTNGNVSTPSTVSDSSTTTVSSGPKYFAGTSSQQISLDIFAGGLNNPGTVNSFSSTFAVPEPSSMLAIGSGIAGLAFFRRKRRV